jgi:hypothetical protein
MCRFLSFYISICFSYYSNTRYCTVICNAKSKGLSNILQKIILFATDQETYDLATSMGITSYYSEAIFKKMPKEAAKEYADDTFRLMMFAKVYCVHIVSQLGYNFLFQDVDVIWYKNPLDVSTVQHCSVMVFYVCIYHKSSLIRQRLFPHSLYFIHSHYTLYIIEVVP